jgi:hypothetical protein
MDPQYAIPGVLLLVAGYALIALGGPLHTWPRPSRDRPVTSAERAVLLLGAFAILGGILLIGRAIVGADNGSGGSSPM